MRARGSPATLPTPAYFLTRGGLFPLQPHRCLQERLSYVTEAVHMLVGGVTQRLCHLRAKVVSMLQSQQEVSKPLGTH